jgi:hypothetical protein
LRLVRKFSKNFRARNCPKVSLGRRGVEALVGGGHAGAAAEGAADCW